MFLFLKTEPTLRYKQIWQWSNVLLEWTWLYMNSLSSRQDQLEFLWEQVGLIKIPLWAGRPGQNSFFSRQDYSVSLRACKIGPNSSRNWQDWSEFLEQKAKLVRIPLGTGRIIENFLEAIRFGRNFFGRRWEWDFFFKQLKKKTCVDLYFQFLIFAHSRITAYIKYLWILSFFSFQRV